MWKTQLLLALVLNVVCGLHLQEPIEEVSESQKLSAVSFIKYLQPLYDFLHQENKANDICKGDDCESKAREMIEEYSEEKLQMLDMNSQKAWEYYTSISDETQTASNEASELLAAFEKKNWEEIFTQFDYESFEDEELKRRFDLHATLGTAGLEDVDFAELTSVISQMTSIYGAGRICPFNNQECDLASEGLTLEPDIESILADAKNRSWEELVYVWAAWRDVTGRLMREKIPRYVELSNLAAEANDLTDMSEMWLSGYSRDLNQDDDFQEDLESIWNQMRPLYLNIHAYIRWRLRQHWGDENMPDPKAAIPAHIFGNMWAQEWQDIFDLVSPYPDEPNPLEEVDVNLLAQNYTVRRVFELSNSFYRDLGLDDMEMCYDTPCSREDTAENRDCVHNNPMIEKPDWDVVCHASAWDMYKPENDDFRIKMCTEINLNSLITVHHEMGHIQYYLQYKDKHLEFRSGANPGFHEAIGDTMALSVNTPVHLEKIGLLNSVSNTYESDINFLLTTALKRVVFLPFAYTIDQYRWALFNGSVTTDRMNEVWWDLREKYQGITAPVERSDLDFDAGAKYHVAANVPYIRYFVAHILQYQFYRQMCLESGNFVPGDSEKPLHKCDFSQGPGSILAGLKMKNLLSSGSSLPWPDVLEEMTGLRRMDAGAILDYFAPLSDWLEEQIVGHDIPVGWE